MKRKINRKDIVYTDPIYLGKDDIADSKPVDRKNVDKDKGYEDLMFFTPDAKATATTEAEVEEPKTMFQPKRGATLIKLVLIIAITLVVVGVLVFSIIALRRWVHEETKEPTPMPTAEVTPAPTEAVHTTWKMVTEDYGENRWFSDGIAEIKNAKTETEAGNAANVWLDRVKRDANLLVGAVRYLLKRDVDKTTLIDPDGWASNEAVSLVVEMQIVLAQSRIVPAEAPANGINSGVTNNTVVSSTQPTITGNRNGILITLPNGEKIWIMARCGNIVIPKPPTTPTPTPSKPAPTPTTIPTPTLQPKSSNPADYKQPGDDKKTDAGTGVKPPVPTVSTPAESTPPPVNTTTPTTAVVAPSATPVPTQAPEVTPSPTPIPEPSVNPTDGAPNSGDPGNPFG